MSLFRNSTRQTVLSLSVLSVALFLTLGIQILYIRWYGRINTFSFLLGIPFWIYLWLPVRNVVPGILSGRPEIQEKKLVYEPEPFPVSVADILVVKQMLMKKGPLPLELVDTIIDFAEYWVRTTTHRVGGEVTIPGGRAAPGRENLLLLRSYPLGYVPKKRDPTSSPMSKNDEYISIPSVPWNEPGGNPYDVTQEVVNRWTEESLSRGEFPCRKIVFTIKSHDQGWGGPPASKGTYKNSSTWFDVGLEQVFAFRDSRLPAAELTKTGAASLEDFIGTGTPSEWVPRSAQISALPYFGISDPQGSSPDSPEIICITKTIIPTTDSEPIISETGEAQEPELSFRHALDPSSDCLQRNRTSTSAINEYRITWSCTDNSDPDSIYGKILDDAGRGRETANGEYVRNLKVGDVVTLWGKARYPGWTNHVEEVKVDVYWAL